MRFKVCAAQDMKDKHSKQGSSMNHPSLLNNRLELIKQ